MPIPAASRAEPAAAEPHSRKHRRSGPVRPADTASRRFPPSDIRYGVAENGAWRMIWRIIICLSRAGERHCRLYLAGNRFTNIFEIKPSFRDGPKDQASDVQLHIGESRDSGFALRG